MASELKVNTIKKASGSTITVGESGDTVTLASGAVVSGGFKDIQWQSVITADGSTTTTAEAGKGYFIDNSSATHTINLPASPSIGDVVKIVCLGNAQTYNVTIGRNSSNIQGATEDRTLNQNNQSETFVYSNATEGWALEATTADLPTYITATGGTETTSGDYKIHTFTSSGCFVVSCTGNQSSEVSYLVVAGGGSGGINNEFDQGAGGGGAGGFREGKVSNDSYTQSPAAANSGLTISATTYPITVGAGGAAFSSPNASAGNSGSNSVFSTITSTGGGGGGSRQSPSCRAGVNGGSGGGGAGPATPGGTGNTPPVSPSQGNNGASSSTHGGGGGGGIGVAGTNATEPSPGGAGGDGLASSITGSPVTRAGGGGGGGRGGSYPNSFGAGGAGGGGAGSDSMSSATNATANTGGGGGGTGGVTSPGQSYSSGAGGSGIVIIRYKYQ